MSKHGNLEQNKIENKRFGHSEKALIGCPLVRSAALAAPVLALARVHLAHGHGCSEEIIYPKVNDLR